jgi:hypothetical protein
MTTEKTGDDVYTYERATQRPEAARPLCPQFRPCPMEELDPVRGHCRLSRAPGWFMIPNFDTYSRYCTRLGFAACGWFGAGEAMVAVWPLPPTVRARP